jgi:hypothetical protein
MYIYMNLCPFALTILAKYGCHAIRQLDTHEKHHVQRRHKAAYITASRMIDCSSLLGWRLLVLSVIASQCERAETVV